MQFNTNISPKHFERTFIEIRRTSLANKVNEIYKLIETKYIKDVPFYDRPTIYITSAKLVHKRTIRKDQLTESDAYFCYNCNLEIALQILNYFGTDENQLIDVLTFNNSSLC